MTSSRFKIACALALVSGAACTDLDSATNLNPEGPPMIRQVRLREMYLDASGSLNERVDPVFAFGTHPQVTSEDEAHPVMTAKTFGNPPQSLRVIMDEILVGNNLEEIACRTVVDDDAFAPIPLGANPDDIARCAVASDVLETSCPGSNPKSVCICQLDTGCGNTGEIKKGESVGVLDANQDGAADDMRFIGTAVALKCGTIDVPLDVEKSYWNPSGDQNVPALGGFDALGPALVLFPSAPAAGTDGILPTNSECGLVFDASVVDKQGNQVCAPPDGDVTKSCTPGDTSAFKFKTEPLAVRQAGILDGEMGVSRTGTVDITLSAPPSMASLTAITVTEGATPYTQFTVTLPQPNIARITWTAATGLAANTTYTITVGTGLTDLYNQAAPMPVSITFTTGA